MMKNPAAMNAGPDWAPHAAQSKAGPDARVTLLEVVPEGRSWLIKHNHGVLGRVGEKNEAVHIVSGLAAWCKAQGRSVILQAD